ncbi:MAG TPA: hypothetical protein ENK14_03030 [Caldithrix sp.]|nr:hypothetical protein [Caldithrix sp.]
MIKRKSLFVVTLAFLIIFSVVSVYSQVTVVIHQPPPDQLKVEHLWKLDLINNTDSTFTVKLRGMVTETSEGLILEASSSEFKLPPGFMQITRPEEISPIDVSYANTKYKEIIIRTGSVPAGDYEACIYVLHAQSGAELGKDCIQQQVSHPTPPQLISPADGAQITEKFPVFTWLPPIPIPPGQQASYKLKIVEILTNQSPIDAMQSNPAYFEQEDITSTSFQYPISARALYVPKPPEPYDGFYAWQVTALVGGTEIGKSEVWSFKLPNLTGQITLVSPKEGATLPKEEKYPLFQWTPPTPTPPGITYNLKIVEIQEGQSKEEAMNNTSFFEKKGIKTTSFKYPSSAKLLYVPKPQEPYGGGGEPVEPKPNPPVKAAPKFAWQVTAFTSGSKTGESKVGLFYVIFSSSDEDGEDWALDPVTPDHGKPVENPNPGFVWRALQLKNGKRPKVKYSLHIIYQRGNDILNRKNPRSYYKSWTVDSLNKYTFFTKNGIKDTVFEYPKDAAALKSGDVYMWWVEAKYKNRTFHSDTISYFPFRWTFREYDFGDAPDPTYPTLRLNNGARHKWECCGDGYTRIPGGGDWWPHDISTKCLCCERWHVAPENQAWLGKFFAGYSGTLPVTPPPGWECSDLVARENKCLPENNGIDIEGDSRIRHATHDNYDDGVYFNPRIYYCCANDSVYIDVMVHIHRDFNRTRPLYFIGWMDWNGDRTWTAGENIRFTSAVPLWGTITPGNVSSGVYVMIDPRTWPHYDHTGACCAIYRLNFPCNWDGASTMWARFRLFVNDAPTANDYQTPASTIPGGETSSGEVEDYRIECQQSPDTTCQCECDTPFVSGPNLVVNGDFATGTITPNTSGYSLNCTTRMTQGEYCIDNTTVGHHPSWSETGMGGSNFLMLNGSTTPGTVAWRSSPITVTSGSTYRFCVFANNLIPPSSSRSAPSIQLKVNSVPVSPIIPLPENPNVWVPITGTWTAGVTAATLEILSTSIEPGGNDFGIDCISFIECTPPDSNQCQCEILKVHINGTPVEEGDRIDISGASVFLPVSRDFDVTANCNDCSITSYGWTITKPDGSTDTNSTSAFTYSFTRNGLYTFEITITCSDGSTCSRTFSVNIEASGGATGRIHEPPIR